MPQGSKTGFVVGGRVRLVEQANRPTKTRKAGALKRWRASIAEQARVAMGGRPPWQAHCRLSCEFVFARPASHWTTTGKLRKGAPDFPGVPDLSKLVRAVEDALTGIVYRDDSLVSSYGTMLKRYTKRRDGNPGVVVAVEKV